MSPALPVVTVYRIPAMVGKQVGRLAETRRSSIAEIVRHSGSLWEIYFTPVRRYGLAFAGGAPV
jgi:hypothetical protein